MGGTTADERFAERRLREAERRLRELEGELELVRHRAAEFEQQVRLAVDAAWRWLGETGERVTVALTELEELRRQLEPSAMQAEPDDELLHRPAPTATEPVEPDRFDAALSRLREQIESGPGRPR